jgi:cytosine/adenosine deaminase-related metal-dependent hydrolase
VAAGAGLVWCPTSNLRLFGKTAEIADLVDSGRVALGSDSRLTGGRDLLEEVRVARDIAGCDARTLESLVTEAAAKLLRLTDRGTLRAGARADILVLPAALPLSKATRTDIRLVMLGGNMCLGDRDLADMIMPSSHSSTIRVDGRTKIVGRALVGTALALETGVELMDPDVTGRAA